MATLGDAYLTFNPAFNSIEECMQDWPCAIAKYSNGEKIDYDRQRKESERTTECICDRVIIKDSPETQINKIETDEAYSKLMATIAHVTVSTCMAKRLKTCASKNSEPTLILILCDMFWSSRINAKQHTHTPSVRCLPECICHGMAFICFLLLLLSLVVARLIVCCVAFGHTI